ncbi:hypothetical protein BTO05_00690 [Winogradskyella sp. PC-19]|uniref:DUF748 domain-containing protein n=3 Tax=unclassified Winogradskyella TaxID=2615021 RepID=UPI000B3D255D|nr:DUF748 domain-containing protein [Winogradskyella sp. PC-19]ARV08225.1 hypothetical protein BTO05_00690 [Winogradskyella sp. PC-19]
MYENNDTDLFSSLDTLILNLEPLQLIKDKIEIEQFYAKGLRLKAIMKNSSFNFDDLTAFYKKPKDSVSKELTKPLKYNISNIELKDAHFIFDDKNIDKETHINDLSFTIPKIVWDQQKKSNADIAFKFNNGGYFQSLFNINPINGAFDAEITLNDLSLQSFYEYIAEYAELNNFKGLLSSNIKIEGNTNEIKKSLVSGDFNVNNFEMIDASNRLFLSAKDINTQIQSLDYYNKNYIFDFISIENSYTFFELDSLSNNFFRIFKIDQTEKESSLPASFDSIQKQSNTNLRYAVNKFNLNNGVLDYTDNLTGEPFNYNLSAIKIDSDSITNSSEWLDIYATMLLNERGTLKSEIGIDPNNFLNSTLDIAVENFLLEDLNIYTNYYMGHRILKGDMYYFSKSKLTNGNIESRNKLIIKNASLENSKGGLYDLPLKFAFFLLTDKNGDVELDIPVKGDLKDPSTNLGPIIWKTFKNVIGKTVAAPVNFLVGLVGGDPKELEELNFKYTDTLLSKKHKRQLSKLLNLERKKDSLKITMTYYVDSTLLKEALEAEYIGSQYNKETQKDYIKDEKDFYVYLQNKVGNDSLTIKQTLRTLTKDKPIDSMVVLRGEHLIKQINTFIKQEYPISNIQLKQGKSEAPENSGSYPRFLITYGLLGEGDQTEIFIDN